MASRINADSSNGLQLVSDSSGEIQIQSNGVTVATINSSGLSMNSGTLAGNGPAFYAYRSGDQSITSGVATVVQLNAERYDTDSCFDTSTYKFTPTVAGYYQINGMIRSGGTLGANGWIDLSKNGVIFYRGQEWDASGATQRQIQANTIVYLNGSTDYVQLQALITGTAPLTFNDAGGGSGTYTSSMSGFLVRAA